MRCPDCNKFVSFDEPECEVVSSEVVDQSILFEVNIQLKCADCGIALKEATAQAEEAIDHTCDLELIKKHNEESPNSPWSADPLYKEGEDQYEILDEGNPEGTDRLDNIGKGGELIKDSRYMKRFYGFTLTSEVKCLKCGEIFSVETSGEKQASSFEECC